MQRQVDDLKIRIRLYFYHDLDLVSLYREGRISISKFVKYALNAFARKDYTKFETGSKKCEKAAKPVYMFNIVLDEKKDKDAIDLLNKIANGYRNNFIKQLLRLYLNFVIPDCYTSSENKSYFSERACCILEKCDVVPAVSAFKPTGAVIKECMSENQETLENEMEMYGGSEKETSADDTELVGLFKNMLI